MCEKCDELLKKRQEVINALDEETKAKLKRVDEVSKELEELIVQVMIPDTMDTPPRPIDIEDRAAGFLEGILNNVMRLAIERVQQRWPEEMEKGRQAAQDFIGILKAAAEEMKQREQEQAQEPPVDNSGPKHLN